MDRRRALATLASLPGLGVFPSLRAQDKSRTWRVGFLAATNRPVPLESHRIGALPSELRKLGYIEGRNLLIDWHFAEGKPERLPALAADLVAKEVDVIVSGSDAATAAASKATRSIPIVMASSDDPVASGFVKDLARPGTNVTGLSSLYSDLGPKQLEILRSAVPGVSRVVVLAYSGYASAQRSLKNIETAAKANRIRIIPMEVQAPAAIADAFQRMPHDRGTAVIVATHPLFNAHLPEIADAAKQFRLPAITALREFAEAGGLIAYGQNLSENYREAARYVDRILRGAKPAELPVLLPSKLELLINQGTARALGIKIPKEVLLRADTVIE